MRFVPGLCCAYVYMGCNDKSSTVPGTEHVADQYLLGCQQFVAASKEPAEFQPHATESCYRIPHSGDKTKDVMVDIFFLRHAQSEWDNAQEGAPPNSPPIDDVKFRDAQMTAHGVNQVMELNEAIIRDKLEKTTEQERSILKGESVQGRKLFVASSNLRRAGLSLLIAFGHLFKREKPLQIHIVSALQAKSSALDTLTLSAKGEIPYITFLNSPLLADSPKQELQCPFTYASMAKLMEPTCNDGDENSRSEDLMLNMCTWLRNVVREDPDVTDLLLAGHGGSIKSFFKTFHPKLTHALNRENLGEIFAFDKNANLANASLLKFQLILRPPTRGSVHARCEIVPKSTKIIAGSVLKN